MKLASYRADGADTFGIATPTGLIDLGRRTGLPDLKSLLRRPSVLAEAGQYASDRPDHPLEAVTFLPTIPNPDKVIGIGLNYRQHIAEVGATPEKYPVVFIRFADAQTGHRQPLVRPRVSEKFDFEGELGVVIGSPARHVKAADALRHVAGYTIVNDGSIRDWQGHTGQYGPGKNFVASGSIGPWLVTADEIPDPAALQLTTWLNGTEVQNSSTGDMLFAVPALIEYLSTFTELKPGDVIATGTPSGVGLGRRPRLWMKAGDTVEIEISGIGRLVNPVIDEV